MYRFWLLTCAFVFIIQCASSKEVTSIERNLLDVQELYDNVNTKGALATENTLEQRAISDVWNSIKNTAVNAWTSVKAVAQHTKERLKAWVDHIKLQADRISEAMEEKIKILKSKLNDIVHEIFGDGEVVKKCLQQENEKLNQLLLDIVKGITTCISDKLKGLANIRSDTITLNDTVYINQIESKLNKCVETEENINQCYENVRKEILEDTNEMENELHRNGLQSRKAADDILEAIVTCSTDGLIEASAVIAVEVVEVIKCVVNDGNLML